MSVKCCPPCAKPPEAGGRPAGRRAAAGVSPMGPVDPMGTRSPMGPLGPNGPSQTPKNLAGGDTHQTEHLSRRSIDKKEASKIGSACPLYSVGIIIRGQKCQVAFTPTLQRYITCTCVRFVLLFFASLCVHGPRVGEDPSE